MNLNKKMRLTNIHLLGNEDGRLRANTIYAELRTKDGDLAIGATLEYILKEIRDRKYVVDNVLVKYTPKGNSIVQVLSD